MARRVLRYVYAPMLLVGVNGLAIHGITSGHGLRALPGLLAAAIALSFGAERILPYNADWNRSHGDGRRDLLHAVVNEGANAASIGLIPVLVATFAFEGAWPSGWPFVLQLVAAILVLDLGVTLTHYASHRVPLLWRFHAVHHSVKRMYGFNGLMKHPIHQGIELAIGTLPLILLGLPLDVGIGLGFCTAVQLLLQHSNIDYRLGPARYVLAAAEVHRFHHQKWAEDGDVNFGLFTTLCDHLLGTFHYEPRSMPFRSEELGIGAEPDYPDDYVGQLLRPFSVARSPGA